MLIYTQVLGILRQFLKGNLPHRWGFYEINKKSNNFSNFIKKISDS